MKLKELQDTILLGSNANDPLNGETFKKLADGLLEIVDNKLKESHKNFNVADEAQGRDKREKKLAKKRETASFLKALAHGDTVTLHKMSADRAKALNETTNSEGGFLVPEEFESTIISFDEKYDSLANDMMQHNMTSDVKNLNVLTGDPTTNIVGELQEGDSSQLAFGAPVLTVKKYMTIVPWSNELGEDNELAGGLDKLVASRIARSQSLKFENELINGVTAGSEGILQAAGVTVVTMSAGRETFAEVTIDDLFDMEAALGEVDELEIQNAKYYMSRSVYTALRKQKTSGSGEYFLPLGGRDAEVAGMNVVLNNRFPKISETAVSKKFIVLSDFKTHGHVGNRAGIRVNLFDSGVIKAGGGTLNLITQDATAMRVVRRRAFTSALPTGIVVLRTAAA